MRPLRLVCVLVTAAIFTATACNRQKKTDDGKTYTSSQKAAPASSDDAQDNKPLDAPADTTNGKKSQASDNGSSSATHGQVVAQPGSPVQPPAQKPKSR